MPRRRFNKDFKASVARMVVDGAPVKQVARTHAIDPGLVRQWRDEFRDLGDAAFEHSGKRRFSREFKERVVRRVEQGVPVKKVARDFHVDPAVVRRWRDALRHNGVFSDAAPKTRAVIFRLNEEEYSRLKAVAKASGARSLSDFARTIVLPQR